MRESMIIHCQTGCTHEVARFSAEWRCPNEPPVGGFIELDDALASDSLIEPCAICDAFGRLCCKAHKEAWAQAEASRTRPMDADQDPHSWGGR